MPDKPSMNVLVHGAFRRDLARFDAALATFPAGSRSRADQLKSAWDNYEEQLHHHHTGEETLFWPALEELGADVSLVEVLDNEHESMRQALDDATAAMTRMDADPTAEAATEARAAVAHLHEVLTMHLDHEERDLEPISQQYQGAPQIKAAEKAVRQQMKGKSGTFIAWLLDGATTEQRATLTQIIPSPVVFIINTFGGRDYRKNIAPVWAVRA